MGFKKDFLWGGSISAAQIEGAWNEDGKSPVLVDYCTAGSTSARRELWYLNKDGQREHRFWEPVDVLPEGSEYKFFDDLHYTNHVAGDFYHHYKEDLALFAEMGYTTFNTSISWARIYPDGIRGGINKKGVDFYRDLFKTAVELGMDPVITLYKYDEPVSLNIQHGGWSNPKMIDEFVAFAKVCFTEFKEYVNKWMTFNEINIIMPKGDEPKEKARRNLLWMHHQFLAAAKAVIEAHKIDSRLKVGCMICGNLNYPLTPDPLDSIEVYKRFQDFFGYSADVSIRGAYPSYAQRIWREFEFHLNISDEDKEILMKGKSDFLGFSYYASGIVTTHSTDQTDITGGNVLGTIKNPYLQANEWGWQIDPIGFKLFLHIINDRYQVPLFDVENGIGLIESEGEDGICHDTARIDYHREHIKCMKEAVEEGVNLFGYTTWGCIDLVSAGTGQMDKRYGFIYVDMNDAGNGDLHRSKKESFYWYKKVIESNGEDLD
ncbi:MAG: glycoside hydrolase family 1 protein [Eggerthia catenaformis]|uniref:glycoside hydrolase family 1 protein n=1 Tax=Eggerthia catenaformis TaxID=31973 RepID=UPI003FA0C646